MRAVGHGWAWRGERGVGMLVVTKRKFPKIRNRKREKLCVRGRPRRPLARHRLDVPVSSSGDWRGCPWRRRRPSGRAVEPGRACDSTCATPCDGARVGLRHAQRGGKGRGRDRLLRDEHDARRFELVRDARQVGLRGPRANGPQLCRRLLPYLEQPRPTRDD